jgi:hypothetical protein
MNSFCNVLLFNFYILTIICLICIVILLTTDYNKETVRNYCSYVFTGFLILSLIRYSLIKKPDFTFCEFIGGSNEISGGNIFGDVFNSVSNAVTNTVVSVVSLFDTNPVKDLTVVNPEYTKERPRRSALPTTDPINYGVNRDSFLKYRTNDEVNPINNENVANAMKDLTIINPIDNKTTLKTEDPDEKNKDFIQRIYEWWTGNPEKTEKTEKNSLYNLTQQQKLMYNNKDNSNANDDDEVVELYHYERSNASNIYNTPKTSNIPNRASNIPDAYSRFIKEKERTAN